MDSDYACGCLYHIFSPCGLYAHHIEHCLSMEPIWYLSALNMTSFGPQRVFFGPQKFSKQEVVLIVGFFRHRQAWLLLRPYHRPSCLLYKTLAWHRQWGDHTFLSILQPVFSSSSRCHDCLPQVIISVPLATTAMTKSASGNPIADCIENSKPGGPVSGYFRIPIL